MRTIGNILWFLFGGLAGAAAYFVLGILYCITIIGIPIGRQCFKLADLALWPFGKRIEYGGSAFSFIANVIWFFMGGIETAIAYCALGLVYCITIIGIPFGKQCFKLAKLSLAPFGARIY